MQVNKPHREFHAVDMNTGLEHAPRLSAGIEQKVLAGTLNEERRSGSRTRLLRFRPRGVTPPRPSSTNIGKRST